MKHVNFFKTGIRLFTMLSFLGAAVYLTGCDKEEDPIVEDEPTQNIMEIIISTPGLDSLEKYLNFYPDLVATLSSTTEFTFFAPDNAAFATLLAIPGFPRDIRTINPDIIKSVLAYHVATGGGKLASELTNGSSLPTAQGEAIGVTVNGTTITFQTGSTNPNIAVKTANVKATNGVIHIVGTVMIPPTIGGRLAPILGTAAGVVLLGADFTHLATLITKADEGKAANQTIVGLLANQTSGYLVTMFAPPNPVFAGAAASAEVTVEQYLASINAETANAIIRNHIVTGAAYSVDEIDGTTQFTNGMQLNTVLGQSLTASIGTVSATNPNGVTLLSQAFVPGANPPVGAAPIFRKDIGTNNGIVQVVGGVLSPAQ